MSRSHEHDERFWESLQRALDKRRDPREDEAVQAAIAERPERLGELERLLARLERLPRATIRPRPRRVALIGALALPAAALLLMWCSREPTAITTPRLAVAEEAIRFECTRELQSPGRRLTQFSDGLGNQSTLFVEQTDQISVQWTTQTLHPNHPRGMP